MRKYNVPENFDKPGEFQWEALDDAGAREIISTGVSAFLRQDAFSTIAQREKAVSTWLRREISSITQHWGTGEVSE